MKGVGKGSEPRQGAEVRTGGQTQGGRGLVTVSGEPEREQTIRL